MTALAAAAYNEARLAKIAAENAGGGAASLWTWEMPVLTSKTFAAFTRAGKVRVACLGGTGSGGSGAYSTGANSSPIGIKVFDVAIGDILTINIGAGGAPKTGGAGNVGNSTKVVLNGTTIMTAQPGEPGKSGATPTVNPAAATATVTGADRVIPGLQARPSSSGSYPNMGGAAVDVFATGLGRGANPSNGSFGGSVGSESTTTTPSAPVPLFSSELGVSFIGLTAAGAAGVGGLANEPGGMFAGGGGNAAGGVGAGGGGSSNSGPSGKGGDGYAYIVFVPEA